jgi:hypothetical protein
VLNVVEIPDSVQDPFELGLLLPVPGLQKNSILLEDRDGSQVQRLTATAVLFRTNGRLVFRDRKIKIDLLVTDARFAPACSRYDKGGGWVGGASAMVVANAVSKARAAIRSRGKMLVGQVRYPWIQRVGSAPKKGFGNDEKLVFEPRPARVARCGWS